MTNFLSPLEKEALLQKHRAEKNSRTCDRIKCVLLADMGYTYREISRVLFLNEETISRHIADFRREKKLHNNGGGSKAKLSAEQSKLLIAHIEGQLYLNTKKIRAYVKANFSVQYSRSGMIAWLHQHRFSYKKPSGVPAKADKANQDKFIKEYAELKAKLTEDEVIIFGDGVHPTMNTKIAYGWIRTGQEKEIKTTASKTRINVLGAINIDTMNLVAKSYKTINSESTISFLDVLKAAYPEKKIIHFITDNGSYYRNKAVHAKAKELGIIMMHLPTYSPNLNPIERLWKYMNEKVRNNVFFHSAKEFREAIMSFLTEIYKKHKKALKTRINDNFQTLKIDTLS